MCREDLHALEVLPCLSRQATAPAPRGLAYTYSATIDTSEHVAMSQCY